MTLKIITIASLTTFFVTQVVAESLWPIMETNRSAAFVSLGAGPSWGSGGNSETINLQSDIQKTYRVIKAPQVFALGDLFLGCETPLNFNFLGQFGLSLGYASNATLTGYIWEDANPNFSNFLYTYHVNTARVQLKAKILSNINSIMQPYVSAALGVAMNRSHDFTITPLITPEVPAPAFVDATKYGLSYAFGLGLQTAFNADWQMGIGYELADLGKSHLGQAPGQTLNSGLSAAHLYSHALQLSVTYVFNEQARRY